MKDVKEKQEKEKECKKCRKKEGRDRGKEEQREECGGTGGEGRRLVTPDELDRRGAALVWRWPAPSTARNSPEAPLPPGTGATDAHRSSPPPGPSPRPSPGTTAQAELRPRPPCPPLTRLRHVGHAGSWSPRSRTRRSGRPVWGLRFPSGRVRSSARTPRGAAARGAKCGGDVTPGPSRAAPSPPAPRGLLGLVVERRGPAQRGAE